MMYEIGIYENGECNAYNVWANSEEEAQAKAEGMHELHKKFNP